MPVLHPLTFPWAPSCRFCKQSTVHVSCCAALCLARLQCMACLPAAASQCRRRALSMGIEAQDAGEGAEMPVPALLWLQNATGRGAYPWAVLQTGHRHAAAARSAAAAHGSLWRMHQCSRSKAARCRPVPALLMWQRHAQGGAALPAAAAAGAGPPGGGSAGAAERASSSLPFAQPPPLTAPHLTEASLNCRLADCGTSCASLMALRICQPPHCQLNLPSCPAVKPALAPAVPH